MTTLAIIGSGIMGRSLVYTLAKEKKSFDKITLFSSESFAFPCSINSTAVVAPRGLSRGHSLLGDLLIEGYEIFRDHVCKDAPLGVEKVNQFTCMTSPSEAFKARYPGAILTNSCEAIELSSEALVASEEAFLIHPPRYLTWLLTETQKMRQQNLEVISDFVTEIEEGERISLRTQSGKNHTFDRVIFTSGAYSRFWLPLVPDSVLKTSKTVQGSYLEFQDIDLDVPSFSMTLNGDNLIWNAPLKCLILGSTSLEATHQLPPKVELINIYKRLKASASLSFPDFALGEVKVGLREKAQKRSPYLINHGRKIFVGGLYKNGYSLALKMAKSLSLEL